MPLRSITYTSLARLDLQASDLEAIHETAVRENARRNITGLLIFNGTHFLQILEGPGDALSQLIENLRGDQRPGVSQHNPHQPRPVRPASPASVDLFRDAA